MPSQLWTGPRRAIRQQVREICFPCHQGLDAREGYGRPPKRPVKFHEFPRLATFMVSKRFSVDLERLDKFKVGNEAVTPELYRTLSSEDSLALWKKPGVLPAIEFIQRTADFGRGGWLSRVVDPHRFEKPIELGPDSDSEYDDENWRQWSEDASWRSYGSEDDISWNSNEEREPTEEEKQKAAAKAADELQRCRQVVAQMHTFVEAELCIYYLGATHEPWGIPTNKYFIDQVQVLIDARTRTVVEIWRLEPDEVKLRERWWSESH